MAQGCGRGSARAWAERSGDMGGVARGMGGVARGMGGVARRYGRSGAGGWVE